MSYFSRSKAWRKGSAATVNQVCLAVVIGILVALTVRDPWTRRPQCSQVGRKQDKRQAAPTNRADREPGRRRPLSVLRGRVSAVRASIADIFFRSNLFSRGSGGLFSSRCPLPSGRETSFPVALGGTTPAMQRLVARQRERRCGPGAYDDPAMAWRRRNRRFCRETHSCPRRGIISRISLRG